MITQVVKTDLVSNKLDTIIFRSQEEGRDVQFVIVDDDGEPIDMTGLTMKFYMVKPDNNLIVQTLVNATLTETEQMTTAHGMGFYTIRISDQDLIIYTGQGRVLIDDHTYSDDQLESISEVDGLVFPDDFLTTDSHVAVINDLTTNTQETWSSSKISGTIADAMDEIIDDDTQAGNKTWSSNKINDEILDGMADMIDDDAQTTQKTWSSDKIADAIAGANPIKEYKTTPQQVAKWIDGRAVFEKTVDCGSMPISTKNVAHGISGAEFIWPVEGFFVDTQSGYCASFNLASNSLPSQANIWVSSTDIEIWTGTDRSNYDQCYVTLRYVLEVTP